MYNRYNGSFGSYRGNNGDRFGGGFVVPFVLGGLAGSLWNNNGHNSNNYYYPYPTYPYQYYQTPYYPYQYFNGPNNYY